MTPYSSANLLFIYLFIYTSACTYVQYVSQHTDLTYQ